MGLCYCVVFCTGDHNWYPSALVFWPLHFTVVSTRVNEWKSWMPWLSSPSVCPGHCNDCSLCHFWASLVTVLLASQFSHQDRLLGRWNEKTVQRALKILETHKNKSCSLQSYEVRVARCSVNSFWDTRNEPWGTGLRDRQTELQELAPKTSSSGCWWPSLNLWITSGVVCTVLSGGGPLSWDTQSFCCC